MGRLIDAIQLKISIAYSNILEDGKTLDQIIDEQPTIEPERKKGKWIDDGTEFGCCCDSCGITLDEYFMGDLSNITLCKVLKFCPNCGADMRGEE